MKDFYSGILKVPVAGATLPVAAFFLLGIYGSNVLMLISTVILGIGHIGIHLGHAKEAGIENKKRHILLRIGVERRILSGTNGRLFSGSFA